MLTEAEYRHAKAGQNALQGKIDAADREVDECDQSKQRAQAKKDARVEEMTFYTGFMKDAFEEYEAAHPPGP